MELRYPYGYNKGSSENVFNQKNCAILTWKIVYFVWNDEECEQVYRPETLSVVTV